MFGSAKFHPSASPQHDPLGGFGFDGGIVEELRLTRGAIADEPRAAPINGRNSFIEENDEIPAVLAADAAFRAPLPLSQIEGRDQYGDNIAKFGRGQRGVNAVVSRRNVPADATWVTVFGFQPSIAAQVKAQVEQLMRTEIVEYRQACGNYMHVRFRSHTEAKNALQLTGHVLDNGIMIGVVPCISTVMEEEKSKASSKPVVKIATIPSARISTQPSILDPLWKVLDYLFEY